MRTTTAQLNVNTMNNPQHPLQINTSSTTQQFTNVFNNTQETIFVKWKTTYWSCIVFLCLSHDVGKLEQVQQASLSHRSKYWYFNWHDVVFNKIL